MTPPGKSERSVRWVPDAPGKPGHFKVRVRYADGSRPWVHLDPDPTLTEDGARARGRELTKRAREEAWVRDPSPETPRKADRETVDAWVERFFERRKQRGLVTVATDRGRYKWHVAPVIGRTYTDALTRDDIENVRDAIDEKIRNGYTDRYGRHKRMKWKHGRLIWNLVTSMVREMSASKDRALRCLAENLCLGVLPPDRGRRTSKVYAYPSEIVALLADESVPLHHRRNYAIATYAYLRADELDVLRHEDIDLEHGYVNVTRALKSDGTIGLPKGGKARRVLIEPALVPLLEAMKRESGGEGRLTAIRQKNNQPALLRAYLDRAVDSAGLTRRAELFDETEGSKRLGLHDLRASGITWRAVRGDALQLIRDHAGHEDIATTMLYVREADAIREGFGTVFPELPACLIDPSGDDWTEPVDHAWSGRAHSSEKQVCQERGSNPKARRARITPDPIPAEIAAAPVPTSAEVVTNLPMLDHAGPTSATMLDQLAALVARAVAEGNLALARALLDAQMSAALEPRGSVIDLATERARRSP